MVVWGRPEWMVVEWDESNRTVFTPFINPSTFIISIAVLAQTLPHAVEANTFVPACDLPRKIRAPARTKRENE